MKDPFLASLYRELKEISDGYQLTFIHKIYLTVGLENKITAQRILDYLKQTNLDTLSEACEVIIEYQVLPANEFVIESLEGEV